MLFSFYQLNRILRQSTSLKRVGSVRIVVSEIVSVPFSVRFFRTKWVVLPIQILERKLDFKLALKHELQHHRQLDTVWAVFIELLQCFFYFNPALYGWKNMIIELQEFSCDEALTGQRGISARDYGSCLVRVAETALENRNVYAGTTCMAAVFKNPKAFKSLLRRRIEMITQDQRSVRKLAGTFIGTVTLLFTVAIAYGTEQSSRNKINAGNVFVDASIQKIADQILMAAVQKEEARSAFAIFADPLTGKILAVANVDTQNQKKGYWALSQEMEPASLMKAIVAAEGIEEGTTTPTEEHDCENGAYQYGGRTFHDWSKEGSAKLSTTDTVARSSDICSMKIAEKIGARQLYRMLEDYGFGANGSAKNFPSARTGYLPAEDESEQSPLIPATAYGTGFKVTPLELIQAFGAIANGGNLLEPKLVNAVSDEPQVIRRVLSEENALKTRKILQEVVLTGTAWRAASSVYTMAGKTESGYSGGVLKGQSTGGWNRTDIAGFIGFAPALNPKIEIYVAIFNPSDKTGAHGSVHAAPVFAEIADAILKHLNIAPDKK